MVDTGGGHLRKIQRAEQRISGLEGIVGPYAGVTDVAQLSDFGTPVANEITLLENWVYVLRASINWGAVTLVGKNVTIIGNQTLQTLQIANSANAMFASNGDGNFTLLGVIAANSGGPFVDWDLGALPLSVGFMDSCFFTGDPSDTGVGSGSVGMIQNTDRISVQGCFFQGLAGGIQFDGSNPEISIRNCSIRARQGVAAPSFKGVNILATSTTDIVKIDDVRFISTDAADRSVLFDSGATYNSPIRVAGCTHRGPGTFVDAAGLDETSPFYISEGAEGDNTPNDSVFIANLGFNGNIVETVLAVGVYARFGASAPTHLLFNGGGFVERFTLTGAETQSQVLTCDARRERTYRITMSGSFDRVGGGVKNYEIAFAKNGSVLTTSETTFEATGDRTTYFVEDTITLTTGDTLWPVVRNLTDSNNVDIVTAKWSVGRAL
jgi:hypothetical protein